jgi:phosphatidylglycerol:prolipoprotein diacylglycerol transferase
VHPRLLQLGPLIIPTSGAFAVLAILSALFALRLVGRRLGLDIEKLWDLGIVGVLAALISPRILLILMNWQDFRAHPLWMIGIFSVRSQTAVVGGIAVAIVIAGLYVRLTRLPFRRTLDALAPAFALGFGIVGVGDFIAGPRFGTATNLPWAITYTSRLAGLWYGTPLGAPLHPVQLYAALINFCLFGLLLVMIRSRDRWRIRDGEIAGAFLFLCGVSIFLLSFLRGDLVGSSNQMVTLQLGSGAMVFAGGLLWLL